jgi:hypothetical protein
LSRVNLTVISRKEQSLRKKALRHLLIVMASAAGSDARDTVTPLPLLPIPDHVSRPGDKLCDVCRALNLTVDRFIVYPGDEEWIKYYDNGDDDESNEDAEDGEEDKSEDLVGSDDGNEDGDWSDQDGDDDSDDEDLREVTLGTIEELKKKTSCPFCRLLLVSLSSEDIPTHVDGEPLHVKIAWSTDGPIPDPDEPWIHVPEVRLILPDMSAKTGEMPDIQLNIFPEITLLANDSPTSSITYFVRPYQQDRIDFAVVKRWLNLCETHHDQACRRNPILKKLKRSHPTEEVPNFRCIDVERDCVSILPSGYRYAALSYTWGGPVLFKALKSNIADLEQRGSLSSSKYVTKIPGTIQDTIQVAKELNIKYLWVDNLCIVQDDDVNKLATIKAMDLIYAAADLVIVAAGSESAKAGIKGLWPRTRHSQQPIEEIAPGFRLGYRSRWANLIEMQPYHTRGWTYQETHFATRSLIFIDGRVVFRCHGIDAWEEHLIESPSDINREQARPNSIFQGDIGEMEALIQEYSRRVLSYDNDVYNAFAGVSRQLMVQLDTDLCHGLPTRFFDWFLLWGPLSIQTRRLSNVNSSILAPSWSWSGWVGTSYSRIWDWYNRDIGRISKAIGKRTWIIWYQRAGHDSANCKRLVRHRDGDNDSKKTQKNFYGISHKPRFNSLNCSRVKPTQRILRDLKPPQYTDDILGNHMGSGFLQFWTVSLILRLADPKSGEDQEGVALHKRHRLGIFGRNAQELGTVIVQPDWLESNPIPQEREFILVCEGRDVRAKGGRINHEEGWRYMAMLLAWVGKDGARTPKGSIDMTDMPMYAERVAIGSIGKQDLGKALEEGPIWKEIILG